MHELSVAHEILRIVEAERARHGFEKVRAVRVRAGALSGIDPEALAFAFETVREGTCAAEARLDLDAEPRLLTCRACGAEAAADDLPSACPKCGSPDLSLDGAMGLDVVSLEVD